MDEHLQIFKFIFVGSIKGNFSILFRKLQNTNEKHGPFEAIICTGSLFGDNYEEWPQVLSGHIKCPIPMLVLGPQNIDEIRCYENTDNANSPGLIAPGIYFLGSNGVHVTSSGFQIAFMSFSNLKTGEWGICPENTHIISEYIKNATNFKGVDFFITPVWPTGVLNWVGPSHMPKELITENGHPYGDFGHPTIDKLASVLKPRYHLCSFGPQFSFYYQRVPYKNHATSNSLQRHICHFVSLADYEHPSKLKDTYAVKVSPITCMSYNDLCVVTPDVTETPYPKYMTINDPIQVANQLHKKGSITVNPLNILNPNTFDCWFCLANPNIQKHMIFHIGNYNYATLAKGGLVPHHILLCPISHLTCVAALDEETNKEMQSMKKSIRKMFRSNEKSVVIFERNYHSQHLQLQIVPIPKQNPTYLADVFVRHGKKYGMDFTEIKNTDPLSSFISPSTSYFYIELDNGIRLIHLIKGKIPIQFGREVLASPDVLSLRPDKVDWKKCELNSYQETTQATQLGENFKLYL